MKVIINSGATPRREYSNLPERKPDDLLRQRLGEKRLEEERFSSDETSREQPVGGDAEASVHHDLIEDYLSDQALVEEAGEQASRSWKTTRWAPVAFLVALAALSALWYFAVHYDREMKLERISVRGANLLSDKEIVALAGINSRDRFYQIDLRILQRRLLAHSLIKAAHPRRELNPSTIVLDIEERQPVAMLRSETSGEAFIIDRDGMLLRPKLIAGLRDPARLMQVPLLTGVSERDTVGYQAMARLVGTIAAMDSGALATAIGELRRTPTGAYVIYTAETQTPIFIGSPFDTRFQTALEEQQHQAGGESKEAPTLFRRQLELLAKVWRTKLHDDLRSGNALYVDARFSGQVILKRRQTGGTIPPAMAQRDSTARRLITSVMKNPNAPDR